MHHALPILWLYIEQEEAPTTRAKQLAAQCAGRKRRGIDGIQTTMADR